MSKAESSAISPTRGEDFPEWYQQVIKSAELAENSSVRGCMVIRPWGYGIWERLQKELDQRIKETGHENAYFPLFIPLSYLEKEATHVEGFAKECAVVTHHRLELQNGKLVPTGKLEEPLIVRPTSETIIGESFAKWVQSYRDLPLLINQWANVVRWEMRPRMFLRTTEFLWQEGHTVHATEQEAIEETKRMLGVYQDVIENVLAMAVIPGEKSPGERFPGADMTTTVEAMMQDRKALQAGTSHYLGQNFAKASEIKFLNQAGEQQYAYTTSWGASTRLIGGMVMSHADDDGLRVPPKLAPKQVVILPVVPKPETAGAVYEYVEKLFKELSELSYGEDKIRIQIDKRDLRGGEKNWQWIKKGVPIRIEVGPRDAQSDSVVLYRRDKGVRDKSVMTMGELKTQLPKILSEIQANYLAESRDNLAKNTISDINNYGDLAKLFTPKNPDKPEIHGGFVKAKWSGEGEDKLSEHKLSIRCIPFEQSGTTGKCIITGKEAVQDVIIAKSY